MTDKLLPGYDMPYPPRRCRDCSYYLMFEQVDDNRCHYDRIGKIIDVGIYMDVPTWCPLLLKWKEEQKCMK